MRPELRTLTSLRFFAALHVLVFHFVPITLGVSFLGLPDPLKSFVMNGFVGVPFFFSLSGFVLFYAYADTGIPSKAAFWWKRYARLAPAFYLSLLVGAPLFWWSLRAQGASPFTFARYLCANLAFVQTLVPESLRINHSAWSLTAEAFFYLTFPFLLPVAKRLRGASLMVLFGIGFFVSSAPQIAGYLFLSKGQAEWPHTLFLTNPAAAAFLQYNPFFHWGEFCFGVALGRLFALHGPRASDSLLLGGSALILASTLTEAIPTPFLSTFVLLPAYALVLYGGAGPRGRYLGWLETRFLVLLGDASYAFYILHDPLINQYVALRGRDSLSPWLVIPLFTILLTALSIAVLKWWEKPARVLVLSRSPAVHDPRVG